MADTIRLNKVLRELNISIDRVADFLESKGHTIEKRPTTKISKDLYSLLCDEFQIDADKKIASKEVVEAKNKEKEEIREKQERQQEDSIKPQSEIIKASSKVVQFKKLGKIDLEPKKENEKAKTPEETNSVAKEIETQKSTPENVENVKKDNYKKLSGLRSTGETIDLNQFKKTESSESTPKSKKRRRRIVSKQDDSNQNNTSFKAKQKERFKRPTKEEPSEEEVQQQIKETLEKLQGKSSKGKAAKYRRDKRDQHKQKSEEELAALEEESKILKVTEFVTASEIATMMDVSPTEIISACMTLGMMVTLNQRLDAETLSIVAEEFGYKVEFVTAEIEEENIEVEDSPEDLEHRPPIVTVMGHVDHGKTSLLDVIREKKVAASEAGGITQHIGSYIVEAKKNQMITFIDTPGHAAFSQMRARGSNITDVIVLVVAADDSVNEQTIEAISHAKASGCPIIVAVNKIDLPTANAQKVESDLMKHEIISEKMGGQNVFVNVSAKTKVGIEELLDSILLQSEILELKANPNRSAEGTVIESKIEKGKGTVVSVLIQNGSLKVGDVAVIGKEWGKVRAMYNDSSEKINI